MKQHILQHALNPAQLQAATAKLGNLLILAGAGSGKTRVLVYRIIWLIVEHNAPINSIFAVTFTNKAAAEMRHRVAEQLQQDPSGMWIGTFHGLAHKLLRLHHGASGLPAEFQVMDGGDQLQLIKRILKKLSINEERWEPKQVQNFISRKKDEGKRSRHLDKGHNPHEQVMLEIYRAYEQTCQQEGLVDFSELLLRSYELLNNDENLRAYYQQKFKHFFVDEFQDTNKIQYAWLKLLTGSGASVTVVGDDDQSIYGWRGACVENIYKFEQDYVATTMLRLEQNYRSTGTILAAANAVIARNGGRFEKTLWTETDKGDPITLYVALNEEDEALYVVKQLQQYRADGGLLQDAAILYRSNAQSRVLEEAFLRAGMEYSIYGGLRFFERAEIKDALAYLRLVVNKYDNVAFERAINTPPRGIGAKSLEKIREIAMEQSVAYWDAAQQAMEDGFITGRATSGIAGFMAMINTLNQLAPTLSLSEIISKIIQDSGLLQLFQAQPGEMARSRIENLKELVNAAGDFALEFQPEEADIPDEQYQPSRSPLEISALSAFLSFTALDAGSRQDGKGGVQMMTLHSAKGLEFNVVFMCGVEEGLFPHHFSKDDPQSLEEERRLCYVGITRAKKKLIITHAEVRRLFGREETRRVSRFISEIPVELITEERRRVVVRPTNNYASNSYTGNNYTSNRERNEFDQRYATARENTRGNNSGYNARSSSAPPVTIKLAASGGKDKGSLIGRRVKHGKFGRGLVIDQEGNDDKARINVNFEATGVKWLMLAYANLEVLA